MNPLADIGEDVAWVHVDGEIRMMVKVDATSKLLGKEIRTVMNQIKWREEKK